MIGQLLLVALGFLYRVFARGVAKALDAHNAAVGVSLGSFLLSGGIACGAAISGPSRGWQHDIAATALFLSLWLALIAVAHFLTELLVFRSSRLGEEVTQQGNIAAALFKAVIFLAVTLGYAHG